MTRFRGVLRLCAGLGVLALVASYLGGLHPAGDSLAVFRLWIAAAVALAGAGLLVMPGRGWGVYCLALAAVAGATPAAALFRPVPGPALAGDGQPYAIYQRNLNFAARDTDAILAEIGTTAPDFVTLQEVSAANRAAIYDNLPDSYDRAICPFAAVGEVAIASRHRFRPGSVVCVERLGLVAAQAETPDGPVWLVSVHLHWPWPYDQARQTAQILPLIARMEGPVLIGGDFNMVRWSDTMRGFERASGSRIVPQGRPTYRFTYGRRAGPGLEIDLVLLPGGETSGAERLDYLGSDHRGVMARFGL